MVGLAYACAYEGSTEVKVMKLETYRSQGPSLKYQRPIRGLLLVLRENFIRIGLAMSTTLDVMDATPEEKIVHAVR
jgi:hypothetical protein